ncbi:MAG: hypothetical protein RI556_02965 [Hydrogenovibrio sp.]|uniref:hypothetical protein n=1 Tax=Hydrogenovibrio sp. TaxID=2065821 RepID=UPI0028700CE5|nr:hypothetical protein [Hydrogenovibrio sp.]MDR9498109.1 hypothetical protein [Hydrogenovibrio sp.]
MLTIIKFWLLILLLTAGSWYLLKLAGRPLHIGWVFLFWVATLLAAAAVLYGLSLIVAA